jgi:hypothetical protein
MRFGHWKTTTMIVAVLVVATLSAAEWNDRIEITEGRAGIVPVALPEAPPPGADAVASETLDVMTRIQPIEGDALTLTETITRTVDRIHLSSEGREWLFVRNVRDRRRVSGTLVDHAARAIVFYSESDLRNVVGVNGWADTLKLGFEPGLQVVRAVGGVNPALLRNPAERFPEYRVFHLAEWLESGH